MLVHACYQDGTELCFHTTLNPALLAQKGIVLEENRLPILDKTYLFDKQQLYKQIPIDGIVSIEVVTKPCYKDKKAEFLSAFF